jgi:hypothetical protein
MAKGKKITLEGQAWVRFTMGKDGRIYVVLDQWKNKEYHTKSRRIR